MSVTQLPFRHVHDSGHVINQVLFSPSGGLVLGAGGVVQETGYVVSYDSATLERQSVVETEKPLANTLAFSREGTRLATSCLIDNKLELWDTGSWKRLKTLDLIPADAEKLPHGLPREMTSLRSISFNPNGSSLAAGGGDLRVKLWDLSTGVLRELKPLHKHNILHVCWLGQGEQILSADDQTLRVWSTSDGTLTKTIDVEDRERLWTHVAVPESSVVISVCDVGVIRVWDLVNWNWCDYPVRFKGYVRSIDFAARTGLLAIGLTDGRIILWSLKKHKQVGRIKIRDAPVMSLAFSPNGLSLACVYSVTKERVAICDLSPITT